jgi:hypothetical protein
MWGREPALIIGAIVTVLINLLASLAGEGFISDVLAGTLSDLVTSASALILALLPLITAALIRQRVSPAK